LTTTGLEKGQTSRAIQIDRDVNRSTTSAEYFGADSNPSGTKMYTPGDYQQPKRPQLQSNPVLNPIGKTGASAGDYGSQGYKALPNNRSTTNASEFLGVSGFMKAAIAPLMDVLRPSKKENVVGNINPSGNVQMSVKAPPVFNPADRAPTTIKETTVGKLDCNHLNIQGQVDGAYTVTEQQSVGQERDTTSCQYYGDGGNSTGVPLYNAAYNQRNNVNKTHVNRPNQGGMSLLNTVEIIRIDKNDCDRNNNRLWDRNAGGTSNTAIASVETFGKINVPQYYDNCQNCDRINPDILNAFKENPYTKSLSSY
jgi:hypothetical protein